VKRSAVVIVFGLVVSMLSSPSASAAATPFRRVLAEGGSTSFYVDGPRVQVDLVANGATLFASVNRKSQGKVLTLPDTGDVVRVTLAWGLPAGPQRITLTAREGSLDIRRWVIPGGRMVAGELPLLAVYGDSIALGMTAGGTSGFTGGWADAVAPMVGHRVTNLSAGFTSAACYGKTFVGALLATDPDAVIVAFGVNDMITGPNGWGCTTDLDGFIAAMGEILAGTDTLAVPVFVSAILPTGRVREATRAIWNAALEAEVGAHAATWVDPTVVIDFPADFVEGLHPTRPAHARLAEFWAGVLSQPAQVVASSGAVRTMPAPAPIRP
jgi:hypothetical protein